jgi:AcrR family transcriptional regulator
MPGQSPKAQLLDQVIEHLTAEGLGDQSLRQIAAAVGSSHRMLLYHFGSKEGLLVEVARAVEARTQDQLRALGAVSETTRSDDVIRQMWALLTDPALAPFERLFFALYGRALQGEVEARPLLAGNIEDWLETNAGLAAEHGVPVEVARVHARLGMAVTRGLLLDLLATGDRAEVDAALELFAGRYAGEWWASPVASSRPR